MDLLHVCVIDASCRYAYMCMNEVIHMLCNNCYLQLQRIDFVSCFGSTFVNE
jgi:hypothetical protein